MTMTLNRLLDKLESNAFCVPMWCISIWIWSFLYFALNIGYQEYVGKASSVLLIFQIALLLFRAFIAKNSLHFVIWGFIALYVVPAKLYFFDGLYLSMHHMEYTDETVALVVLIFSLFLIFVNLFLRIPACTTLKLNFKDNKIIFWLLLFLSLIVTIMSKRSGSLYDGSSEQVEVSVLNEYVLILYLVAYIYTGGKKNRLYSLYFLWVLYIIFTLSVGGRIEAVLLFFLLLTIKIQYIFSFRRMVFLFLIGIWFMEIVGKVRSNPQILLDGSITEIVNPFGVKEYNSNVKPSNEGDVFWASERLLLLIEDGELPIQERIVAAISYFFSPFVPTSYLPDVANLPTYKRDVRTTGGGGLAPVLFYVMFGLMGPILLGVFFAKMLNSLRRQTISSLHFYYAILLVTMIPRWIAYNSIYPIKLCLWGVLCYYFFINLDYTMKRNKTFSLKNSF